MTLVGANPNQTQRAVPCAIARLAAALTLLVLMLCGTKSTVGQDVVLPLFADEDGRVPDPESDNRSPATTAQTETAQQAQTPVNIARIEKLPASLPDAALTQVLERRGNLTLQAATLVEALFTLRSQWKVDMVVSKNIEGEVNATFNNASLREILDSLLLSRGYGYQVVGRSIVVLPLEQLGSLKPLFNSEIIKLEQAAPDDLINVVEALLSPQGKAIPVPSSNSIMVLDYPDRVQMIRERMRVLDRPRQRAFRPVVPGGPVAPGVPGAGPPPGGRPLVELDVRVFRPQYVKVQTLLPAIESLLSQAGRVAVLENEDQIVIADRVDLVDVIEEAVQALDRPRPQVRIWAMIYDCSLEDIERLGVNWDARFFGRARRADGTPADQIALNTITAAAPAAGVPNGALTVMSLGSNVDVTAMINALRTSSDSRLLADPNVVVSNHEPAKIEIVTEIPYQQLTEGLEGGTIGTTAFREAGVTLEVTPHIARDRTISMFINPRFSVLAGFTENDEQPIIDRREAKTTLRVANGETFVLGGLRQRSKVHRRTGIPYLKDMKYVGKLFRFRQDTFRESELLVFITPEIIGVGSDPRPREHVARELSLEELNRNRRAPDVDAHFADLDIHSFGGPAGNSIVNSPDAPPWAGDALASPGGTTAWPPGPSSAGRKAWSTEDPGVAQRLTNRIRVNTDESRSSSAGSRTTTGPTPNGEADDDGLTMPNLDVKELLNILQMKGERSSEPQSRRRPLIQQLRFTGRSRPNGSTSSSSDRRLGPSGFTVP